jgi:hypothetical protein
MPPLNFFVVNSSAQPLKCMGKTERIGFQIFIDVFFDQNIALKALRLRKSTQRGADAFCCV